LGVLFLEVKQPGHVADISPHLMLRLRMNEAIPQLLLISSCKNSQQDATVYQNLLFYVYIKLNMFWAAHRPSSGAQNCTSSLWLCIREWMLDLVVAGRCPATTRPNIPSRMHNQRLLVQF